MGYSNDLRVRVIQVVENGMAARAAARQFVIGDATAIRWVKRWRETGSVEAKSIKASRSPLKRHEEWLLDLVRQEPDLTLEEIQRRLLDERAQKAGIGSVWRFFDRNGISFKKAFAQPSRIDLTSPRRAPRGAVSSRVRPRAPGLHRRTGTSTNMARLRGRAPRGERLSENPARPLEDDNLRRRLARKRAYRTLCHRRPDERQCVPGLYRANPGPKP